MAKSRIGGSYGFRRELAAAMARDTVRAVLAADNVAGVMVVCQSDRDMWRLQGLRLEVLVHPAPGLNEAIAMAGSHLRAHHGACPLAVLPADLPYLNTAEFRGALEQAAADRRTCVSDHEGTGTTLLAAPPGRDLEPAYGPDSWDRHIRSGAIPLAIPAGSGLRRDVDHPEDLVLDSSLGPQTRALLERITRAGARIGSEPRRLAERIS